MTEVEGIDVETYAGKAAIAVKTKARGIFGDDFLIFELMDFVEFMLLNNKFNEKGYFITEENREEMYIKVIESGEEALIDDLEKYINFLDKLNMMKQKKEEYTQLMDRLRMIEDKNNQDDINPIIYDYLRR